MTTLYCNHCRNIVAEKDESGLHPAYEESTTDEMPENVSAAPMEDGDPLAVITCLSCGFDNFLEVPEQQDATL